MSESLGTALLLLVVGMLTVFVVLFLVVLSGQFLIRFTNRYLPVATPKYELKARTDLSFPSSPSKFSSSKMAAIAAAVDVITQGKGKITAIKKEK